MVISVFKKYGFSQTQISNIIRAFPSVLLSDPHKTLLPKLEVFQSKAFTSSDIATVLSKNSKILQRSLKNYIISSFFLFKNFFGTNEDIINAIIRFGIIPVGRFNTCVLPNVNLLREIGVAESNISSLLKQKHSVAVTNPVRFKEIVEKVKEMGFNPLKFSFIQAVFAMVGMNKSTWERKVNVYKRWDLSQEEILAAFRKCPCCIIASEDKIMQVMDFYVNKMGFEASFIVNRPILIIYSLEKRLIPRASVIEVLQSKGLIKKNIHLARVFSSSENSFLQKFVTPYMDKVSDLLKLYKGKLDFSKMTTK